MFAPADEKRKGGGLCGGSVTMYVRQRGENLLCAYHGRYRETPEPTILLKTTVKRRRILSTFLIFPVKVVANMPEKSCIG